MRRRLSDSAAQTARKSPMNSSNTGSRGFDMGVSPPDALLVQRLAFDGAAAKQATLLLRKVGAGVDRAAVVPHQEIAELPDVLEDEFASLADVVELFQDRIALLGAHALDARRHQPVDEQRLATGVGMRDENRVQVVRDPADVAGMARLLGAVVFVDVKRLLALELLLERGRHRLVGLVHVGEHRIAAGGRQFERIEERVLVGSRRIAGIDVEPEFAVAERADRLPVDLDVGDEQNLLVVLPDALGAAAQLVRRLLAAAEVAETGRKAKLVVLRNLLAAEHQHEMLPPGVPDCPDCFFGEGPGEIDALDLRAAGRRQRRHLDVDNVLHGQSLQESEAAPFAILQPIVQRLHSLASGGVMRKLAPLGRWQLIRSLVGKSAGPVRLRYSGFNFAALTISRKRS